MFWAERGMKKDPSQNVAQIEVRQNNKDIERIFQMDLNDNSFLHINSQVK